MLVCTSNLNIPRLREGVKLMNIHLYHGLDLDIEGELTAHLYLGAALSSIYPRRKMREATTCNLSYLKQSTPFKPSAHRSR